MTVELAALPVANPGADFAALSRAVRAEGLLERRRAYYVASIGGTLVALAALGAVAVVVGNSWWNLAVAAGLAVVLTRLGFIGHDAGHRQISSRRRTNDVIGYTVSNVLAGFSFGWWYSKHNRHHANTNRAGKDPDLVPGAIVYLPEQASARGPFGRRFARWQAVFLVPLLFLEALNLHVASVLELSRRRDRGALGEAALLAVHLLIFFAAPFLLLSPVRAVACIAVTQGLLGVYLGLSFLTNHVGMPVLDGSDELGFLRRQVLTSRNLSGGALTGFVFGGLDTQIEHHLFPTMPRANLRRARRLVRPFCDERGIAYTETGTAAAYLQVVRHLRRAGLGAVLPLVD